MSGKSLVLLIPLLLGLFAAHAIATEITLEKEGGVYKVPVRINGVITLKFILDSGASEVVIPADVVLTLLRTGTIREGDFLPGKTFSLADGSELKSPRFLIRELELGGMKISNVSGSVAPVAGDLLLGQSLLERLDSWALDNKRHVLVLNGQVNSIPASSTQGVGHPAEVRHDITATIVSPENGQEVLRRQTIAGVLSGLAPNQQAFLVIQSTAKQYGQKIYPQARILPDDKGNWSIEGIYASPNFSYKTYVVLTEDQQSANVLSEQQSRLSGLSQLPAGVSIIGPEITVNRK
jgi:hypothetical protein